MDRQSELDEIFCKAKDDPQSRFKLLTFGRERGFNTFVDRKRIWPFLLGLNMEQISTRQPFSWKRDNNEHKSTDFDQIVKDADRSLSSFLTFANTTKFHLKKRQQAVLQVLDVFFAKHPKLKYIQGFHDIASIYLMLFGNDKGYYLVEKAGETYFRDFLELQFNDVSQAISRVIYGLIVSVDAEFKDIYSSFQTTKLMIFIIPWVLTWFSHNFEKAKTICRIWDYLLCTGPLGIFYFVGALLIQTKEELKKSCDQLDDPGIHTFYQEKTRKETINVEEVIKAAIKLEACIDIQQLIGYKQLEDNSMFRCYNFSKQIDLHEQYRRSLARKREMNKMYKKLAVGLILTGVAGVTFYYLTQGKHKLSVGWF